MCGIGGFIGFRDDKLIRDFSQWMKHRGPDGDGYHIDDAVSLLNRRLAIIDVKGGDQPIYNEDKTVVVVYNGEIYNYVELRDELKKKGHHFTTKSDTEVIVHGWEEWGEECFDKLNGMFAAAVYDLKKNSVILVRDHFGIKPLYYAANGKEILFASEIKPLIYSGKIKVEPNDRIIYRYLKYRIHDDGRETFFRGINRLLPGEMMILKDGKHTIKSYTRLEKNLLTKSRQVTEQPLSHKDAREFLNLMTDSVKRRLVSEVPVGTCLSGGLDSSTVVALVNQLLKEKVGETESVGDIQKTFSAVFPGSSNDEEKYIDALLETSKEIKDYKVKPDADTFLKEITDFVRTQEEPTISTGPYAQYKVMEKAHQYVTVVLDGQGSDEMMAGYLPYYFVYLRQLAKKGNYAKLLSEVASSWDVVSKYVYARIDPEKKFDFGKILNKEFASAHREERFSVDNDNLKRRLLDDVFRNSLQSLLRYEDKNAMRFSIEGRVPFLDFRLIELIFSLPDEAIIKDGWNKFILRRATNHILPRIINRRRNKIGFTTPEYEWFRKKHKEILAYFTGQRFEAKKYVNQAEVVMAFQDFIEGKNTDTMFFWRILNLELWLREFFPQPKGNTGMPKEINHEIVAGGKTYLRYPLRTSVFAKGDNYEEKIARTVADGYEAVVKKNPSLAGKKWFAVASEKIISIAQGRAFFIWDIRPGFFARLLSGFVARVPWGIGLGSPWTMQLAINEVGLPRILAASALGAAGKLVGKRGLFYEIAGRQAAGIDGPTEYSLYPANVSAKLLPKNPQRVCSSIDRELKKAVNDNYLGFGVIDANDIGQNILGNTTGLEDKTVEDAFKDNPMGQTNEQTPITLVFAV